MMTKGVFKKMYCSDCDFHCEENRCAPYYSCDDDKYGPSIEKLVSLCNEMRRAIDEAPFDVKFVSVDGNEMAISLDSKDVEQIAEELLMRPDVIDGFLRMYLANVKIFGGIY